MIVAEVGSDHPLLAEAITALLTHIGVYRFDYPSLAAVGPVAIAETAATRTELAEPLQIIAAAWRQAPRRTNGSSSCVAPSPQKPSRTACSTGTPAWYR